MAQSQNRFGGECRLVVKALRQKAAMLMASDPRMAPVAAEIRALGRTAAAAPVHYAMGRIYVEQLGDQKSAAPADAQRLMKLLAA